MFKSILIQLTTLFFFFNDTATTEIYTLSLHDALPISEARQKTVELICGGVVGTNADRDRIGDRKSTRLNSSHLVISYAVFCLKKKKKQNIICRMQLVNVKDDNMRSHQQNNKTQIA